ncbi:MAG: dihydrofolate reductase [Crocinitomicaceae bacterium]
MKKKFITLSLAGLFLASCGEGEEKTDEKNTKENKETSTSNQDNWYKLDRFADIQVLRYKINGFDKLSLNQKKLVYYLVQAGMSGRDIIWDQNYRHNLEIRKAIEAIYQSDKVKKEGDDWAKFDTYAKRVFFSNGIHHHYSTVKFKPEFDKAYLEGLLAESGAQLSAEALEVIFNDQDMKRVNKASGVDLIAASANNFYAPGVTQQMVEEYYNRIVDKKDPRPISYGLNSTMKIDDGGNVYEDVWKSGGLYGEAIDKIIFWLEKAVTVAENDQQAEALKLLIEYYKTGDLKVWDQYNIAWAGATEGDIDYINSFIEVYGDAKGMRGAYETVVQIKDFEASERMKVLQDNVQWFEDNSSIMDEHKKEKVTGVTYKVVTVAGEAGDASPSTPIGVNLPNANWIRTEHGSKSVSLGNIVEAYNEASGEGMLTEFAHDEEEIERAKKYGKIGSKLHTALHEVVGHASGKLNLGILPPHETLKNYSSTLEEARADLVALYYLMNPKMVELGLMESLEVGKAEYDSYIRNGLMLQLRRLEIGDEVEEDHMRNRQLVAGWVFEKGAADNVISKVQKDGKTYFEINDYEKLQVLFGELLKEIQRIKSEGDFEAGKNLVETYGVKVDQAIHKEVLDRSAPLNIAPYNGFVNPVLEAVEENGEIIDIRINYEQGFIEQMMFYAKNYAFLN